MYVAQAVPGGSDTKNMEDLDPKNFFPKFGHVKVKINSEITWDLVAMYQPRMPHQFATSRAL